MKQYCTKAWQDYEAGKEYKRKIGLYETVRQNERFYRGDQWHGTQNDLPHPVFNLVRRVADYLVSSVLPRDLSIRYTDDKLPFVENAVLRDRVRAGLEALNKNALYRWKRGNMRSLAHKALLNAALSGDGVFYCWWDSAMEDGQLFTGDVKTELIDNSDLFVADVTKTDLQSQEYVMLSGRAPVSVLRKEAIANGMDAEDAARIAPDSGLSSPQAADGDLAASGDRDKATFLIRFFREGGEVIFEKSTRDAVICRVATGLRLYPVAYFNWLPTKHSFHGTAAVSDMIPNQKYINTAYAMAMKHMYDTAFSKVIYDKSRIPEWSNQVGEAIAAMGGGNVADAVSVVGVGEMQQGYLELINNVVETTKNMMGATEAALGDAAANNTSAILILQEASKLALHQVSADFCRCMGEVASIWADMLCTYCPPERLLIAGGEEDLTAMRADFALLKNELLHATAEIGQTDTYTPAATLSLLDKLLDGGHITVTDYLRLLPEGCVSDREVLISQIQRKE